MVKTGITFIVALGVALAMVNAAHNHQFEWIKEKAKTETYFKRTLMNCYKYGLFTDKNIKKAEKIYFELMAEKERQ